MLLLILNFTQPRRGKPIVAMGDDEDGRLRNVFGQNYGDHRARLHHPSSGAPATARTPANRLALLPALIHERLGKGEFSEGCQQSCDKQYFEALRDTYKGTL